MDILILLVIIIAVSTFKSQVDKNKGRGKKQKQKKSMSFEEIKREIQRQINAKDNNKSISKEKSINNTREFDKGKRVDINTNIVIKNNTLGNANDSINESLILPNETDNIKGVENNDLSIEYLSDIRKNFRNDSKKAFIYSQIFNRKY